METQWTFKTFQQLQLKIINNNGSWSLTLPYVCIAKRKTGYKVLMFNTEGNSEEEALEKAKKRIYNYE